MQENLFGGGAGTAGTAILVPVSRSVFVSVLIAVSLSGATLCRFKSIASFAVLKGIFCNQISDFPHTQLPDLLYSIWAAKRLEF